MGGGRKGESNGERQKMVITVLLEGEREDRWTWRKMMVDTDEFTGEFEKKIKHRSKDTSSTLQHRTPQKTYVITRF